MNIEEAQQAVRRHKLEKLASADDKLRKSLASINSVKTEFMDHIRYLQDSGYSGDALKQTARIGATKALQRLNEVGSPVVSRLAKVKDELDKLPPPTLQEVSESERSRIISKFLSIPESDRRFLVDAKETIAKQPRLAAALAAEDPFVTGLQLHQVENMRRVATTDEHAEQRAQLHTVATALQTVSEELNAAIADIKGAVA